MSDSTIIPSLLSRPVVNQKRSNYKINILVSDKIDKLISLCGSLPSN